MTPATDVFLSYKAEDRARLVPLVAALEAEGFSVWWDAHIGGGTNWHEDIEQHLDAAKCVVVAWSKRSVGHDGHFVRDEARRAQRRDAYVPVCLDPVEPPLGFGEIQALSLKGWKGDRADSRFQAVVNAVRSHISGEHVAHHPHVHLREPRVTRRGAIAGGIGVGAIAVAGAGGWLLLKPTAANAKRIAVLPFANLSSSADQAYFAEGIAEELRSALSRIGMEVIGRASSDAVKERDTKTAADKLGVAHILSGSVRRSPSMVRINAQLVGGKDGVERWAQSYDRAPGDEIEIQTDIATNVAQALSIALGQAGRVALTLGGTADSAAQDLVLQASELYVTASDEDSFRQVLGLANAAVARDPNYADAYRLKARTLQILAASFGKNPADVAAGLAQAEIAARRAIAIAPKLGIFHTTLGSIERDRFNFASALQHYQRGIALSPDDARVLSNVAGGTILFGDAHEALRLTDRAIALDPLQVINIMRRGQVLQALRLYPQSIAAYRKALTIAPQATHVHGAIGILLTLMDQYAEARAEYRLLPADDLQRILGEGIIAARTGDGAGARRAIAQIQRHYGAAGSYQYAEIYAQLGDKDRAFAELDSAVQAKDTGLVDLKVDPFFDPIRGDPRFAALLRRLKFP